jgi:hypothetical protein
MTEKTWEQVKEDAIKCLAESEEYYLIFSNKGENFAVGTISNMEKTKAVYLMEVAKSYLIKPTDRTFIPNTKES